MPRCGIWKEQPASECPLDILGRPVMISPFQKMRQNTLWETKVVPPQWEGTTKVVPPQWDHTWRSGVGR